MIQFHLRIFFKWVVKNHQLGTMLGGSGFAIIGDECFPPHITTSQNPGAQLTIIVTPKIADDACNNPRQKDVLATPRDLPDWQCLTVGKQVITTLIRGPFINLHDPTGKLCLGRTQDIHIYLKVKIDDTDTKR